MKHVIGDIKLFAKRKNIKLSLLYTARSKGVYPRLFGWSSISGQRFKKNFAI